MTNHTITDAELQAIRSVDCHIRTIAHSDAFHPAEPVLEDIQEVGRLVKRLCTAPPIEEVASIPDENDYGFNRDHPSHGEGGNSQSPSVVDLGSDEIELRWAKETIGLVAVELSEAYAQFNTTSFTTGSTPSDTLCRASCRLEDAMKRLGLTDEIQF